MTSLATPASKVPSSAAASLGGWSSGGKREAISRGVWDAIVIGAGPAGSASAILLARRGWRVLLLERSTWPREKVCGGCLSASAIDCIDGIGLSRVLKEATAITSSQIHQNRSRATLPTKDVVAIERSIFDSRMVDEFIRIGGTFVSSASASLCTVDRNQSTRSLVVQVDGERCTAKGRLVLACDGLGGSSISGEPWAEWTIARDAYIGVATMIDQAELAIETGSIHMHIDIGGYVGAVRYEQGGIHLAAALDSTVCRSTGGPSKLMESILASCGQRISLRDRRVRGSPALTRSRKQIGGHRVLAVGDACGYIEPFTGEGIAWALRSAIEVTTMLQTSAADSWDQDLPGRWGEVHQSTLKGKQSICRAVRLAVRRPMVARASIGLLNRFPSLSSLITRASEVRR